MSSFLSGLAEGAVSEAKVRKDKGGSSTGLAKKAKDFIKKKYGGPKEVPNASPSLDRVAQPMSFKKGGRVKKAGIAKVHKGEKRFTSTGLTRLKRGDRILTKKQQKKMGRRGRSKSR